MNWIQLILLCCINLGQGADMQTSNLNEQMFTLTHPSTYLLTRADLEILPAPQEHTQVHTS